MCAVCPVGAVCVPAGAACADDDMRVSFVPLCRHME